MLEKVVTAVDLRPAGIADGKFLYDLHNDPEVRAQSWSQEHVKWGDHLEWLSRKIADPDTRLYVIWLEHEPIGQLRLDRLEDGLVELSTSLHADHRGQGLSEPAVAEGVRRAVQELEAREVRVEIKPENEPSLRMCAAVGFVETGRDDRRVLMHTTI